MTPPNPIPAYGMIELGQNTRTARAVSVTAIRSIPHSEGPGIHDDWIEYVFRFDNVRPRQGATQIQLEIMTDRGTYLKQGPKIRLSQKGKVDFHTNKAAYAKFRKKGGRVAGRLVYYRQNGTSPGSTRVILNTAPKKD